MNELERFKLALTHSQCAVYEYDVDQDTITWSDNASEVLDVKNIKDISTKEGLASLVSEEYKEKYTTSINNAIANKCDYSISYKMELPGGHSVRVWDRGTVIEQDSHTVLVGSIELKHSKHNQARFYPDSEYFNAEFLDKLNEAVKASRETNVDSVLLKVSIDNLPMIMSWYTMEFADRIMDALEVDLAQTLNEGDHISRISADQFGVILKEQSRNEVSTTVDRIMKRIQHYRNPSFDDPVYLRTSVGSVFFPTHAGTAEEALNRSYLALCSAKASTTEFYCDHQEAHKEHMESRDQITLMHHMQNAFREDRMRLAYQPIVKTQTGEVYSYECLLRVVDENGSPSSAGMLIPIAEKMGSIDMVDQFVLEQIVNDLKEEPNVVLGFNVSNMTTDNPRWLKTCTKMLQDSDVASRIIVEITETAAQRDLRQTAYFVAALQSLGCRVALDDFGAGYTSFRQIKSLSVDIVKIDGAYVRDLADNSENLLFIKTLLDFNRSYGLETIAECVESGDIAKALMETNVDYLQGYYFGRGEIERPWRKKDKEST